MNWEKINIYCFCNQLVKSTESLKFGIVFHCEKEKCSTFVFKNYIEWMIEKDSIQYDSINQIYYVKPLVLYCHCGNPISIEKCFILPLGIIPRCAKRIQDPCLFTTDTIFKDVSLFTLKNKTKRLGFGSRIKTFHGMGWFIGFFKNQRIYTLDYFKGKYNFIYSTEEYPNINPICYCYTNPLIDFKEEEEGEKEKKTFQFMKQIIQEKKNFVLSKEQVENWTKDFLLNEGECIWNFDLLHNVLFHFKEERIAVAHRSILSQYSTYFESLFRWQFDSSLSEKEVIEIEFQDIENSKKLFAFIHFFYVFCCCGKIDLIEWISLGKKYGCDFMVQEAMKQIELNIENKLFSFSSFIKLYQQHEELLDLEFRKKWMQCISENENKDFILSFLKENDFTCFGFTKYKILTALFDKVMMNCNK